MAGKSASVFPLLTTSSFMSIVGVEQVWACAVCIATDKTKKETARTTVEIAEWRNDRFIMARPPNLRRCRISSLGKVVIAPAAESHSVGASSSTRNLELQA